MNIRNAVIQYLANEFQLEAVGVTLDLNFKIDLNLDEKQLGDLLQRLQDSLGITLTEDKIAQVSTVGDLLNLIEDDQSQ